jgi:hypothetical protein
MPSRNCIFYFIYLPKESPIISWDAFLMRPIVLLVAFSTIEPIPILSAPFLTSEKNVSHPRPSIARNRMIIIIHVISSMAHWYSIVLFHLTITYLMQLFCPHHLFSFHRSSLHAFSTIFRIIYLRNYPFCNIIFYRLFGFKRLSYHF